MRLGAIVMSIALAVFAVPAIGDIPPPPDEYTGPTTARLAGLIFDREQIEIRDQVPEEHGHAPRYGNYVILKNCVAVHPNCRLARQRKVLGWVVTSIDGAEVGDDLGAFQTAFASVPKRHKVKLTLEFLDNGGAVPTPDNLQILFDRT